MKVIFLPLQGNLHDSVDQYKVERYNSFKWHWKFCLNMVGEEAAEIDYDDKERKGDLAVKVICLGDSAVGKSK